MLYQSQGSTMHAAEAAVPNFPSLRVAQHLNRRQRLGSVGEGHGTGGHAAARKMPGRRRDWSRVGLLPITL
jgi:hypothetical protein